MGIVGGGIGGLAAALSLHLAGIDVHVYEQAGSISEVGAGVQVSPNATRVLHGLGLGEELAAMGVDPSHSTSGAGMTVAHSCEHR